MSELIRGSRFEFKINGQKYQLFNDYKSTQHGFNHYTTVYQNYRKLFMSRVVYYNRTWECFSYQTSMLNAMQLLIENKKARIKDEFKEKNNIKRISSRQKVELVSEYENNDEIKGLKKIYDDIRLSKNGTFQYIENY